MFNMLVNYDEPLFRPPAEAYSVIIQVSKGCSWNKCIFCEMYKKKKFEVFSKEKIFNDIDIFAKLQPKSRKFFLADGNALYLNTKDLLDILERINTKFARVQRISTYASTRDILQKTDEELELLKQNGLNLFYTGIETGDDELLKIIKKGETFESTKQGLLKAKKAGIDYSVMILLGLGGKKFSMQHALNSAKIVNAVQPKFLSTLVLELPYGIEHYQRKFVVGYEHLSEKQTIEEMLMFLDNLELEGTIFRSDHISNLLVLKGVLNKDKLAITQSISKHINISQ